MSPWLGGSHPIGLLLAAGLAASVVFFVLAYYGAWNFCRRERHIQTAGRKRLLPLPGVTILKPLKDLDADLYRNLSTYCVQDYPRYQIIFGVRDADDPAVDVVQQLRRDYPDVHIDLIVDHRTYGTNFKVSNLHNMYAKAVHEVVVIADSDIRVAPDYLRRIVPLLDDPQVGVVSCLYRAIPDGSLPSLLESLFINTDFGPMVLLARVVETPTYAFGATMAVRRSTLDEIGGFLPLANLLADDYYIGQRVVARGYHSALSDLVVETVLGAQSWRRLFDHQLRWARTYRTCRPRGYFCSIVTHGTLWTVLNLIYHGFSPSMCVIAAAVVTLRVGLATTISTRYMGAPFDWRAALFIPVKDLFVSAMWMLSYFDNTVIWSGHRFRVSRDGQMVWLSAESAPAIPSAYRPQVENDQRAA